MHKQTHIFVEEYFIILFWLFSSDINHDSWVSSSVTALHLSCTYLNKDIEIQFKVLKHLHFRYKQYKQKHIIFIHQLKLIHRPETENVFCSRQ